MKILLSLTLTISFFSISLFAREQSFNVNNVIEKVSQLKNKESKLELSLTGEFLLDTNFFITVEPNDQHYPSVAFDGFNYLVVWQDERGADNDIYGARVSPNGTILDLNGIGISTAATRQENPAVCFDGTNYFVVWQDYRSGYDNFDIFGARVAPTGEVIDPNGIVISTAADNQEYPSVIWNSSNYLVVWQDNRNGNLDIYGSRVSQSGTVLDPAGIAISIATSTQRAPSLAKDNNNYLVVWQDARNSGILYPDIFGARVNQSGVVLDSAGFVISAASNSQTEPCIAFDGNNYLVVWADGRNDDIFGARVTTSGQVLDTSGIAISTAVDNQEFPSIAFDGTNYLVVWQDQRNQTDFDIFGSRVSLNGTVLDTGGIAIALAANDQEYPSITFGANNFFTVWRDERTGSSDFDIYGARIASSGTVIDPSGIAISLIANSYNQTTPSVAFDGTNYLAVWTDERFSNQDIFGTRVTPGGRILDPLGIPISINPANQYSPSVAFDGTNYLVAWTDERNEPSTYADIYATRVNQTGIVLDTAGFTISSAAYDQWSPSIGFDGTNYLVIWEDRRNGSFNADIYGARVTQTGTVLEPNGFVISNATDNQEAPALAFDGTNYLTAWQDERGAYRDIYGARVTTAGTVLEPSGIAISNASNYQESTAVAFDDTNFLVIWQDRRGASWDIYAARVSQAGSVLEPAGIPICNIDADQKQPAVIFDGLNYFVLWQDFRSTITWDIYGAKLNRSAAVTDTLSLSIQPGNQISPALARGSTNQELVTYSGWADSIANLPANSMRIWGKLYPGPGIEEQRSTPNALRLMPEIYPNPFSKQTEIRFMPSASRTGFKIYDITGKLVKSLISNNQELKTNNYLIWSGTDDSGKRLPAGVYIIRLETTIGKVSKEIVILR